MQPFHILYDELSHTLPVGLNQRVGETDIQIREGGTSIVPFNLYFPTWVIALPVHHGYHANSFSYGTSKVGSLFLPICERESSDESLTAIGPSKKKVALIPSPFPDCNAAVMIMKNGYSGNPSYLCVFDEVYRAFTYCFAFDCHKNPLR